jgi:hypothetical protein
MYGEQSVEKTRCRGVLVVGDVSKVSWMMDDLGRRDDIFDTSLLVLLLESWRNARYRRIDSNIVHTTTKMR